MNLNISNLIICKQLADNYFLFPADMESQRSSLFDALQIPGLFKMFESLQIGVLLNGIGVINLLLIFSLKKKRDAAKFANLLSHEIMTYGSVARLPHKMKQGRRFAHNF
mgnify:FL=1